jgi:hypothetical protein
MKVLPRHGREENLNLPEDKAVNACNSLRGGRPPAFHAEWPKPESAGGPFHISARSADALDIDRWAETRATFTNSRWLKPIDRFRMDL